jgi:hypothetical protein
MCMKAETDSLILSKMWGMIWPEMPMNRSRKLHQTMRALAPVRDQSKATPLAPVRDQSKATPLAPVRDPSKAKWGEGPEGEGGEETKKKIIRKQLFSIGADFHSTHLFLARHRNTTCLCFILINYCVQKGS